MAIPGATTLQLASPGPKAGATTAFFGPGFSQRVPRKEEPGVCAAAGDANAVKINTAITRTGC